MASASTATLTRNREVRIDTAAESTATFWLVTFLAVQFLCQIALLFEFLGQYRVVFRVAAFVISFLALAFLPGAGRRHRSWPFLVAAMVILAAGVLHPTTNTPLSAIAHITLNLTIVAPIFWVTRLTITTKVLSQILLLVWGFHTLSSVVGVLQVIYPGQFQPSVSTVVTSNANSEGLKITLADGSSVWRPMGLTDVPGGAASAGLSAVLFGLGFLTASPRWMVRSAAIGSMICGLFCIYLSQVRVALIICGIMIVTFAAVLIWLQRVRDLIWLGLILPAIIIGSFAWALDVGGDGVTNRLQTLVEDSPDNVYYENRGKFLEYTFTSGLEEYPLGAGLGRWGMTNNYFGDPSNLFSQSIWVEIQWTAWLYDGGIPLMIAYFGAMLAALYAALKVARQTQDRWLSGWAALIAAYDVAVIGLTFSYVPFIGQVGLEFWFLNAALHTTALVSTQPRRFRAGAVA